MKKAKRMIATVLTGIMAISAFAFAGCDNGAKETFDNVKDSVSDGFKDVFSSNENNENSIKPSYDGTIVRAGAKLDFSETRKIGFLAYDVVSTSNEYTPVTASLTATVTPSDANQAVTWAIEFVNSSSTWANGKTVTDYVELSNANQPSVNVTCKAPFGEQIKITCTSAENSAVSASCTVDFLQSITGASLTFGDDLPINLGGQTDVSWEVNVNGVGAGGTANVDYTTYTTYTVGDTYSWDIDLISPEYFTTEESDDAWGLAMDKDDPSYSDDYLIINSTNMGLMLSPEGEIDCGLREFQEINRLKFDNSFLFQSNLSYLEPNSNPINPDVIYMNAHSNMLTGYYNDILEGSLYTLRLRLTGDKSGEVYEYTSLINLTKFTNVAQVQSLSLSQTSWQVTK